MKKVNRITKNEDFAKLVHSTKPIRNECFLVYGKINDLNYGRVGISVSKKVGKAVTRNRIKRQIRAVCDENINYSNSKHDIVIVVRATYLKHSFFEISNSLKDILERIGRSK